MEGGNATDGAGGADETGQEEPKRESSPTSPAMTARSIEERNLPFGLGKGLVELLTVARPVQLPSGTTTVARPNLQAPQEASQSQNSARQAAMPSTNVEARQAAMSRELKFMQSEIISQDRTNDYQLALMEQTRLWRKSLRERGAVSNEETASTAAAASPNTMETMMLCPQGITPVLYETGKGQATASLVSLGNVKGKEVFTDTSMEEALEDEGNEFQAMLEDVKQIQRQSPSPPRDLYEEPTDYSSEDSTEVVFTSDETFHAGFFDQREQSQDEAQANVNEREQSQTKAQANVNDKVQTQEMAQASDLNILTENGEDRAQAQHNPSNDLSLSAERE
jgi:hypothetical protein